MSATKGIMCKKVKISSFTQYTNESESRYTHKHKILQRWEDQIYTPIIHVQGVKLQHIKTNKQHTRKISKHGYNV